MSAISPILLTLATAALLIWLGYRWGSHTAAGEAPVTAIALAWLSRDEAIDQLRALRDEMELDGQYGRLEAFLLFDVASYLGFDEAEIQAVVGVGWFGYIGSPADLDMEDA